MDMFRYFLVSSEYGTISGDKNQAKSQLRFKEKKKSFHFEETKGVFEQGPPNLHFHFLNMNLMSQAYI